MTAFRQHYPQGSLLSELLTIHDGLYVVRVSLAIEGVTLSTALAAHATLEIAEDMACDRALARLVLGQGTIAPDASPQVLNAGSSAPVDHRTPPPLPGAAQTSAAPTSETWESEAAAPPLPPLVPSPPIPAQPEPRASTEEMAIATPGQLLVEPVVTLVPPDSLGSEAVELMDLDQMPTASIDLSDIIAQTGVELQRLGWDVNQGREFLEKTYGKRSRHDLTDEELLEFLLYLETQPSPEG